MIDCVFYIFRLHFTKYLNWKKKSNKLSGIDAKCFFIPLYSLTFESAFPSTLYHSCPFHSGTLIVPDQVLSNLERFLLSWQKNNCCQRWANSKNDNYFHSRWQLLTVLSENNCHFENWVIFDNSHFFLSLRQITSFNRSKLEQMELAIIPNKR